MQVLVAGGAGYIGAHMVRALLAAGHQVSVLDNLATGHRAALPAGVALAQVDLLDSAAVAAAVAAAAPAAVMHFSARSLVGESVVEPELYYANNVTGTLHLLAAMRAAGCGRFIFSSTAALFGNPLRTPIDEDHPIAPINPYGASKQMVERILADFDVAYGLRYCALRYFNAAGAAPGGEIGEDHRPESHLIPLVLKTALGQRPAITLFGTDYPTPDGTCVRDYIHVDDLCTAHLLALDYLAEGGASRCYNLGNGAGFSVREVIDTARAVTGREIPVVEGERRPGDPAVLVADHQRIIAELGWQPRYPALATIIDHAWQWHQSHPAGYPEGERK
ncbi:MAG: UDP-glucose 4-epimerase GalE [Nitrospirae bacterium CG18_big_fil_WC_8_21_14_2_50_70_55]|nr:UDP-glucose 4-epimerase GalE [Deltaproteobacteria bacterium]OIP65595.1 MAG: UDP-glucose 4-epimerase GalE [Nitrospirae bacterium CG2_30_70_394]PIQ04767.1 MAG: UDP-glucose 4-epimerase GalE [Nitrospirae bacterium CG18_big_fil_WC_8_21_14_2_50_70_55]PIU78207.1 MAG: UDP-glucose 4-epimerase GalE [Nitrospirae bacterium CG06_land_8_20_14_3_00_70_43]PIW82212.1 MAG: UDP-glucose 4-epimerase GalE [Nitrospirae bacterium CG_4_8_14_3_um_filter_70_85]PIX83242.1 MAG: UDP-glucose 4-epimerase GalE [Nitrospirae